MANSVNINPTNNLVSNLTILNLLNSGRYLKKKYVPDTLLGMKDMLDKILQIEKKYIELGQTLSDPAVIQDYNKFRDLSKQRKSMEETVNLYYEWKKTTDAINDAKEMLH